MVFGLFDAAERQKEAKLQEARKLQEEIIAAQLKELQLEHELERQTMTQKGLINQQKRLQVLEKEKAAAQEKEKKQPSTSTNGSNGSSATNNNSHPKGPGNKLAQHVDMAKKGYEQLVHAIIRPPRASYKMAHLGPDSFTFCQRRFIREDVTLLTERGFKIEGSHWLAENVNDDESSHQPVVVYLHGNASARVEVLQQLSYLLSLGSSVFSFDFAGSGMSDGDYVSLGYYEREDLATVVAHLKGRLGGNVKIALWGRSMGAATALMYASRRIVNIQCLILDSSFCDLVQLAEEMVGKAREQGIVVPNVVVSVALAAIGWSVNSKAEFDIKDISPVQHAPEIDIPALFVCGEQDDFIRPHHSEQICAAYKGSSNLLLVQGDHNDPRPLILFSAAKQFLQKYLIGEDPDEVVGLQVPPGTDLQTCPWQHKGKKDVYQAHPRLKTAPSNVSTVDQSEIGMTKQRQDAIQSSLVTMLGHEGGEKTTSTTERDEMGLQSPKGDREEAKFGDEVVEVEA